MTEFGDSFIIELLMKGMVIMLIVIGPPLLSAMFIGLMVAIFQAVTSIHEQSLSFTPKLLAIVAMLVLLGGWFGDLLIRFTEWCFEVIPNLSR